MSKSGATNENVCKHRRYILRYFFMETISLSTGCKTFIYLFAPILLVFLFIDFSKMYGFGNEHKIGLSVQ